MYGAYEVYSYELVILLPFDIGETICTMTLTAPALHPVMVTRLGSPPNAAMFLLTQRRATT